MDFKGLLVLAAAITGIILVLGSFVGVGIWIGYRFTSGFLLFLFLLSIGIMTALNLDPPDTSLMFIVLGVFWLIVGITFYISTDQTFIQDFWRENSHHFLR